MFLTSCPSVVIHQALILQKAVDNRNHHDWDGRWFSGQSEKNGTAQPTAYRPGRLSPLEILERLYPYQRRAVLELVLQGCNGDLVKAIEHFLSAQDTVVAQQQQQALHQQKQHQHVPQHRLESSSQCRGNPFLNGLHPVGVGVSASSSSPSSSTTSSNSSLSSLRSGLSSAQFGSHGGKLSYAGLKSAFTPLAGMGGWGGRRGGGGGRGGGRAGGGGGARTSLGLQPATPPRCPLSRGSTPPTPSGPPSCSSTPPTTPSSSPAPPPSPPPSPSPPPPPPPPGGHGRGPVVGRPGSPGLRGPGGSGDRIPPVRDAGPSLRLPPLPAAAGSPALLPSLRPHPGQEQRPVGSDRLGPSVGRLGGGFVPEGAEGGRLTVCYKRRKMKGRFVTWRTEGERLYVTG